MMYLHYYEMTEQAAATGAELIIWPETAVPITLFRSPVYAQPLSELAREYGATLLVGTFTEDEEGGKYNSMVVVRPDGSVGDTVYSKRHLVPFGEYVPLRPLIETLFPPLAELVLSSGDIYPGEGAQIIELPNGNSLGGLICFDSIYEELTLESVREGAELICLSTNDSWFIDSAALRMHNAQAQIRAIESGKYIARAANTGISTVINSRGEIEAELGALVDGKIVHDVYLNSAPTLWRILGNSFVYLLLAAYIVVIGENIIFRIKKEKTA
jgi:apolipoprotein N-acyltransferase